jgi:hypothetical protein
MTGIGTLRETTLHAQLKRCYALPGDELEAHVDGYVVDIRRGEAVIEVQTHNFSAIRRKLTALVEARPVRLVHPIAVERWLVRLDEDGVKPLGRRKSPKRGQAAHIFAELVSFPALVMHPNFNLEVALIQEEEVRVRLAAPCRRRWRPRLWRVQDRRLLKVVGTLQLDGPASCVALLPPELGDPFTSHELAEALQQPAWVSQKMTYCLRHMGAIRQVGKRGRAWEYARA